MSYKFQRYLEAASDQTLVEPNWEAILECVDMIRGGEVPVKESLKAIQKRYHNSNPHIAHHALLILEACVKNCGKKFVLEVATKEFMDDLKNMIISEQSEKVKEKILELIQCWTSAFKGISEYKIVEDTHSLLRMNGFEFPQIDESKVMFLADSAPDWVEGENCYRCRIEFGVFTRKHHCRACGQIFCDKCSSKQMLLPQFGIEKKVRVCEACFDKGLNQSSLKTKNNGELDKKETEAREKARKEAEAKEQEELQLALAISQSEAEAKQAHLSNIYNQYENLHKPMSEIDNNQKQEESLGKEEFSLCGAGDELQEQPFDPVLAKYLDRDYWERKRRETEDEQARATAPPPSEISISISSSVSQQHHTNLNGEVKNEASNVAYANMATQMDSIVQTPLTHQLKQQTQQQHSEDLNAISAKLDLTELESRESEDSEREEHLAETSRFCGALKERIDTLNTRMRSNQLRGRSIVNDSAIHSLFSQLTDAHAKVLERMTKLEGQREHFERLQDHLGHIGEARQAVNALREESEKLRQELLREEQNRRQTQLRQKLELMRHKKHEMLLNERQVAIQRFQQNERQILQQRMAHHQSPQTVGGVVSEIAQNPQIDQQQQHFGQFIATAQTQYSTQPQTHEQFSHHITQHQMALQPQSQYIGQPTQVQPYSLNYQYQQQSPQIIPMASPYPMPTPLPPQMMAPPFSNHPQHIPYRVNQQQSAVFPPTTARHHNPIPPYTQQHTTDGIAPLTSTEDQQRLASGEQTEQNSNVKEDLLISFD